MKFKDMEYKRPDVDQLETEFKKDLEELKAAKSADAFFEKFMEVNKKTQHLDTMITLSHIRHSINTADKFYDEENSFWDENLPRLQVYFNEFSKLVYNTEFKEELSNRIPDTYFKLLECSLKSFDEKIVPLLIEENKLTSEYGKLKASAKIEFDGETLNLASIGKYTISKDRDVRKRANDAKMKFYADNEAKFDEIYDKLVKVRDKIAKELGFENYIPLGYYRMTRLDYDQDMVSGYRKQVLDYVTPEVTKIRQKQAKRLGLERLEYYDLGTEFLDGNATPIGDAEYLIDSAKKMYHEMSKETGEFIDVMSENELWDLISRDNKEMGGYMTAIPDYNVPFIFSNFNGTSGDVDVLTHEAGHAFQYYVQDIDIPDLQMPTMESCEIDSMSMEFFAYPWMDLFFGDKANRYRYSHMCGTLNFLPYGVLVDHFQHEVYAHPEMSIEERKACWRKLEKMYQPDKNYDGCDILEKGCWWYQQGHIFERPFYYIDYTLAQVCAQQFGIRNIEKDPKVWSDYIHLLKLGGTLPFTGLVKEAGLDNPFVDGTIEKIVNKLDEYLEKVDDTKL